MENTIENGDRAMSQNKQSQIVINIEPALLGLVTKIITEEDYSLSGYGRSLVISDLTKRGLLTSEVWQIIQADYVPAKDTPIPAPV